LKVTSDKLQGKGKVLTATNFVRNINGLWQNLQL